MFPAKLLLSFGDGDERVFGRRFVDPFVEWGDAQCFEQAQGPDGRFGGEADDVLTLAGVVQHGLVVRLHRAELLEGDYSALSLVDREAFVQKDKLSMPEQLVAGKNLLVIDI